MTTLSIAPRAPSWAVWIAAALAAVALHGALALAAIWSFQPDESDDDIGAPAIEIALDMAAPKSETTDLPPGPDSEATAASPDSAQAAPKAEAIERSKDQPDETDNPDRVVSPETARKPEPEEAKPQPSQASTASVASEATAAPAQEASPPAPVAVAPAIGPGRTAQKIRATWQKRLVAHLDRHKHYPAGEARRNAEASVQFTIDRSGHILSASIARSSGSAAFDEAALAMMRRSDPVPPPPPLVADDGLTFVVPVVFRTRAR